MELRITCITAPDVGQLIGDVAIQLEDRLRSVVEPRDYGGGVDQFAVFFVSVDSDPIQNERYCVANNRIGRYKSPMTGQSVKFVGIAVPVDPGTVLDSPATTLPRMLERLFLDELQAPAYAMPRNFNREQLFADISAALV